MSIEVVNTNWSDYELIDSGNRRKLERFGPNLLIRSEPKAWWKPDLPVSEWKKANAEFQDNGKWRFDKKNTKRSWLMDLKGLKLEARITDMSKHLGIFPEQEPHWSWMRNKIQSANTAEAPRVLNLFGYTGVASLVAAQAGAKVTHCDASKPAIAWGRENQKKSNMGDAPIRWILDDAMKYARREIKRKSYYEGILLDPPSFGRGPKGELWKVEEMIVELMEVVRDLLSEKPLFVLITMYNLEASSLMVKNLIEATLPKGKVSYGELALTHQKSSKMLPLSLFTRWEK